MLQKWDRLFNITISYKTLAQLYTPVKFTKNKKTANHKDRPVLCSMIEIDLGLIIIIRKGT